MPPPIFCNRRSPNNVEGTFAEPQKWQNSRGTIITLTYTNGVRTDAIKARSPEEHQQPDKPTTTTKACLLLAAAGNRT